MSHDPNDPRIENFAGWAPPKPQDADRLPKGKTCTDCAWFNKCKRLVQQPSYAVVCDWNPSRFYQKEADRRADMAEAEEEERREREMLGEIKAQVAELRAQRDEKAQWVTELQSKLAQALAVCNDDLTKMQALSAERDHNKKLLGLLSDWWKMPFSQHDEKVILARQIEALLDAEDAALAGRKE
jgi:predicted RNase H-like nuclease (RuvC/YqgF family)